MAKFSFIKEFARKQDDYESKLSLYFNLHNGLKAIFRIHNETQNLLHHLIQ